MVKEICWSHQCTFCGIQLLNTERNGWCCNQGRYIEDLKPLLALPTSFQNLCDDANLDFFLPISNSEYNLYAFTAIGVSGQFQHFDYGVGDVAITGQVYHKMLDIASGNHSLHWFLYDEHGRISTAHNRGLPVSLINILSTTLELVNPYIRHLRSAIQTLPSPHQQFAIELDYPINGSEVAAIINAANLIHVEPRKIVVFNQSNHQPRFIPLLSN